MTSMIFGRGSARSLTALTMGTLAAAIALAPVSTALAAGDAGDTNLKWRDTATTLGQVSTNLLSESNDVDPQFVLAKVILVNTATSVRDIECILQAIDGGSIISGDRGRVRLPAGSSSSPTRGMVTLQIAFDPTSTFGGGASLSCRVTSTSTSGVTAEWMKMTTHYVTGNVSSISQ